jgi:hypothetical protein
VIVEIGSEIAIEIEAFREKADPDFVFELQGCMNTAKSTYGGGGMRFRLSTHGRSVHRVFVTFLGPWPSALGPWPSA